MTDQIPGFAELSQMSDQQLTQLFGVRDFFTYLVSFTGVAPAATAQQTFNVQSDSNFLWQEACLFADIAHAAQTQSSQVLPDVTVLIQDTASGRQLMSAPVPVSSIFGLNGSLPFLLPTPRFFRAQTQVVVSITNNSAASTYDLQLAFIGTKFFKFAQAI